MIILIAAVILVLVTLAITVFLTVSNWKNNDSSKFLKSRKTIFLIPISFLWFGVILLGSFTKVGANEVGIIYHDQKGILEEVKTEGFQFKSVFEHITVISTINKTALLKVNAQTSDSIYAEFEITLTYKIDAQNAGRFYRIVGSKDITPEQLNSVIKESLQSVTTQYDIFQIMGGELETVRNEITNALQKNLSARYYITVVSVSIDDVDAGTRVEQIIQEKAEAIQRIDIATQEKQKALIEAQTALLKAENDAKIAILKAEADAEAQAVLNGVAVNAIKTMYVGQFKADDERIEFETTSKGGFLKIQEIAEIVVKQLYYDKWDGKLPTVITDGNGGIIIQP